MTLAGRTALVMGGGRGIGAAIARALARAGARTFVVSRTAAELDAVVSALRTEGAEAASGIADVSVAADARRIAQECAQAFGPADILVNTAGVYGPIGRLWEVDAAEWRRALDVNVLGILHSCQAVLPAMISRGDGRIINLSGGGATSPLPNFSAYAASKAAAVRLTETLAAEVREYGITVNAIAPGAVDTRLQDEVIAAGARAGDLYERVRRLRENGAGGVSPDLPAALAVFLASDAAASLTGKLISAPHDGWREWSAERIAELAERDWFTLRRLDPYTLRPLLAAPGEASA
ncbi:MAG: SDR family NAD(P)-dependent oxidoreductase [Longimicrobiales bacterium]